MIKDFKILYKIIKKKQMDFGVIACKVPINSFKHQNVYNIISNGLYQAKKTIEFVILFYKNITKLVFLWLNMNQKSIKMLRKKYFLVINSRCFM